MRHSSASWAWSRSEASVLLIIDDRSLFSYEQWWMGNSLSGLFSHGMSIYIWVQHVKQHKVALLVHFSASASNCYYITGNEIDWSVFFLSTRHLPKPLSNSCECQPQVHMSLKPTFVAADVSVVTTRVIGLARAWELRLSNSDPLRTNRPNWKVCLL